MGDQDNTGPRFFSVPPRQDPPDPQLTGAARQIHSSVHDALEFLMALPTYPIDRDRCAWMWFCCLVTLSWDLGEASIALSAEGPLRGARVLNRSLLEYAARAHLYAANPELAEKHVSEAVNLLRRVMKPVAAGARVDPSLADVKALIDSGPTSAAFPKTHDMFEALVDNLVADSTKRSPYIDYLDAEYALSTAYAHGSQSSFFDVMDGQQIHPRTRVLHRRDEVLRAATSLLALLAALELRHGHDFGVRGHLEILQSHGPYGGQTSMGKHNALIALFGLR